MQYQKVKRSLKNIKVDNIEDETLKLSKNYHFINHDDIIVFIKKNPEFINYFNDILPILKKYYPMQTCKIRYGYDHEYPKDEYLSLEIVVGSNGDVDFELEKWSKFARDVREYQFKYNLVDKFSSGIRAS